MPVDRAIAELAARQELVVALGQLKAVGLSASAVRKRVGSGRLFRQHPGAFSLVPAVSRLGQFIAAVLACGLDATLSHQSAAAVHEIRRHDFGPVHVTVPRTGARSHPGIRVHVSSTLTGQTVTTGGGLRLTTVERHAHRPRRPRASSSSPSLSPSATASPTATHCGSHPEGGASPRDRTSSPARATSAPFTRC